jgi:manganese/iron transport system ATP-binding protein
VFIARAIAQQADVLLLDEPLTGVDAPTTQSLLELFAVLCDSGAAIVATTHDLALVRERFGRCVALNQTVVGDGDPRDVLGPVGLERMFAHA